MAINQNRNSVRVLRTAGGSYLAHRNIPNLSIGTGKDFTIQLWVVAGKDIDGILYAQEGGFSIQLVDDRVVFALDGFATLRSDEKWTLSPHAQHYIAVRYRSGKLTLFLGGLAAAERTVSARAAACAGDYVIGKQFTGGFSLIRVSDTARSDQDILANNAAPPAVDKHCVFQSDCSTAQYKDISANRLPMWVEGRGAGCGIYTACTAFSGKGQVSCAPPERLATTHTLLLKLWPQSQQRPVQRVYAAMDGARVMYAVELEARGDHTLQLSVVNSGGGKATLSKPLLPELWQDVAAVFGGDKVRLYLDGALDGEYSFSFSGTRSDILVGAEYETGKPRYEKGFFGYMAYTAEFNKALSADEIALYADDPPFLFENGLVSLLPLDWPDAAEGIGVTPLRVTGSAPFNMAPDTTPRSGDIGCSTRVPTAVSPDWKALSADEQWALELLTALLQEEFTALCGYSRAPKADGYPPLCQRIPRHIIRHNKPQWLKLREMSPDNFSGVEVTKSLMPELEARGNVPISSVLGGLGSITAAGAVGAAGSASANADAIIAGTAIGAAVAAAVTTAIVTAEKNRPGNSGELKVTAICWNHQGDPARGGLHYHRGGANLPASMVDLPGPTQIDTLCVLVPSKLTAPTLDVTLTYITTDTKPRSGTLRGCDIGGALLGEHAVAYTVAPNASVTVSLPFSTNRLPRGRMEKRTHVWQLWDGGTYLINCVCTFYFLPDLPISPWAIHSGANYDPNEPSYPRVEFLDFFTPAQGQQPADLAAWAVQRLNTSGFVYDVAGGGLNHYCDYGCNIFYLSKFLADARQAGKVLNCADCAHIVATACALWGRKMYLVQFTPPPGAQIFWCNRIIAIGTAGWRYPFDRSGTAQGGSFSYHMFNTPDGTVSVKAPIYDACLKVDGGSYPGDGGPAGARKIEALPTGMPAKERDYWQVNVPPGAPYAGNFYRERLVLNGQYCNFTAGYVKTVSGLDKSRVTGEVSPDPFIAAVMDAFALAPTPEQEAAFAARRSGDWTPEALPGAALVWSGPDHDRWELAAGGQVCQVRHWRCGTAEEAAWRMAAQVAAYTHPDKRPGGELGVEVGERQVVVAASQIVFCRQGHVFTVGGADLDAALAAARALDESVRARG